MSSSTSSVSMSRSLVGSSSTRRFDGLASTCASISRPRSPPESLPSGVRACSLVNRKSFMIADDVLGLAVDHDGVAVAAASSPPVKLDGLTCRVETVAVLIERRDRQAPNPAAPCPIRRQRAGQQIDQAWSCRCRSVRRCRCGRRAGCGSRNRARSAVRHSFYRCPTASMHQRARRRRRAGDHRRIAGGGAVVAALVAQRLQFADPAHIALAPAGDAVAQPVFLGDDFAVELVLFALLFRQHRVAPFLEMGKAALEPPRRAAVEPDRAARQRREKALRSWLIDRPARCGGH